MVESLAQVAVGSLGLYLFGLGAASLLVPSRAKRFLLAFASTPRLHYLEMSLRILAGAALVLVAPRLLFPTLFHLFGWLLVVTSVGLLLIPWRWHHRFARKTVPGAVRYISLIGVASLALGIGVLFALFHGEAN